MMNKLTALLLSGVVLIASSQEIGTELCSCTPSTYEFELDFSLTCPPVNITIGNAVEATSCLVSPFGSPEVENLVPVAVESIDILELGQSLRVIAQTDIDTELTDGDKFTYESAFATSSDVNSADEIVRALQINMVGLNSDGDKIVNVFIITFTNGCGTYPVLDEGSSAGWTRFIGFGPTSSELCAAVPSSPEPSNSPTPISSERPSFAPTKTPTSEPTGSPTKTPTDEPTIAPTDEPTKTPTNEPTIGVTESTKSPTYLPSLGATSILPTIAPVALQEPTAPPSQKPVPSESPTFSVTDSDDFTGTMSMSMSMSMNDLIEEIGTASLRATKGAKKEKADGAMKSTKSPKTLKALKKSSKVQKVIEVEFGSTMKEKKTKESFDGVKVVERLRRHGNSLG